MTLVVLGAGFGIGRATAPSRPVATDGRMAAQGGPVAAVAPRVVQLEGLHTPQGWARFVSDVREQTGSTVVSDAVVYPGYATLTTPVAGNPARGQRWHYQGGLDGPADPESREADQPLVDLAAFSPEILMPLIAGAPETLQVAEADTVYVNVEADENGPTARIYATNRFHESGSLEARPDGTLISVRPHDAS